MAAYSFRMFPGKFRTDVYLKLQRGEPMAKRTRVPLKPLRTECGARCRVVMKDQPALPGNRTNQRSSLAKLEHVDFSNVPSERGHWHDNASGVFPRVCAGTIVVARGSVTADRSIRGNAAWYGTGVQSSPSSGWHTLTWTRRMQLAP